MSNDPNSTNKDAFAAKKKKRMSVERIYQKKTQLEHILLRPDTYIGSVEPIKQNMWIYDAEMAAIVSKEITFVPGLYKIFDEILGKHTLLNTVAWKIQYLLIERELIGKSDTAFSFLSDLQEILKNLSNYKLNLCVFFWGVLPFEKVRVACQKIWIKPMWRSMA